MSTAVLLCVQSAVATAADPHTDSGGLHITAHLLHTVQDTSGQWCVERVMERETLSNNTEYQERLREGRIKGASRGCEREDRLKLLKLDQESSQLQQQVCVVRSRYSQYAVSELSPSLATGERENG